MAIPGLFIEYLISGALALVWLVPLIGATTFQLETSHLPLLALGLYVVGMIVDFIAFFLVLPVKAAIRRKVVRKIGLPDQAAIDSSIARQIKLALYAPEAAKELAMRSSRDRIARGALANALIAAVLDKAFGIFVMKTGSLTWIAVIAVLFVMWGVFESMSHGYELRAELAVDEKLRPQAGPG